jgi:signal transduction histidine kinase
MTQPRFSRLLFLRRSVSIRRSGMFLGAMAMATLLGVLAVLQYRWVGQLSADERDRMRAHLSARADSFADDFNREITRAFFGLQVGTELPRDGEAPSEVERFEHWFATAPRPEIIRAVYQVETREGSAPKLRQFHRNPARLDETAWPAELGAIQKRLQEMAANADVPQPVRFPPVWPEIPAMAMPRLRLDVNANRMTTMVMAPGTGYTIAVLDKTVLQRDVIPALIERHFTLGDDNSLYVSVVGPNGPVYTAPHDAPAPPALLTSPDVKEGLFEIRFFDFGRFVERRHVAGGVAGAAPATPPPGDRAAGDRPAGDRFFVDRRGGGPSSGTVNIVREMRDERGRGVIRFGSGGPGGQSSPPLWRVHVLHRAGSLEAAVERARTRNLVVSFGVLLLLGVSMGMVLVSTGRARRLAAQQMEFVAGVSHELRTPLAVIRSAGENLADGIVAEPKQVQKYGDVIASEGRRLTQMVEQIMDFAGFESGRATLDVRPAEVGSVIEEALRTAAPHLREHGASLDHEAPATLPLVLVDPAAVSRSLQNLIVNALKYGGMPPQVSLAASAAPGEVRITVSDNGEGISARDLPHIFEPFYRGRDATSRQIHGSGLGLSLVKRIMDEIGGAVSVKTESGKGSAFTLHLPLAPEAQTAPAPGATTAAPAH